MSEMVQRVIGAMCNVMHCPNEGGVANIEEVARAAIGAMRVLPLDCRDAPVTRRWLKMGPSDMDEFWSSMIDEALK